jgi:hypothetical protein
VQVGVRNRASPLAEHSAAARDGVMASRNGEGIVRCPTFARRDD